MCGVKDSKIIHDHAVPPEVWCWHHRVFGLFLFAWTLKLIEDYFCVLKEKDGYTRKLAQIFKDAYQYLEAKDPFFAPFFASEWGDALSVSLHNVLAMIFQNLPPPKLLAFHLDRADEQRRACRMRGQQLEVARLQRHAALRAGTMSKRHSSSRWMLHPRV